MRTAKLRVDQQAGAGLQLSACEARRTLDFCLARCVVCRLWSWKFAPQAGYLVEELEEWPGQPEIRMGDVIVAIGEEHEAQKRIRE